MCFNLQKGWKGERHLWGGALVIGEVLGRFYITTAKGVDRGWKQKKNQNRPQSRLLRRKNIVSICWALRRPIHLSFFQFLVSKLVSHDLVFQLLNSPPEGLIQLVFIIPFQGKTQLKAQVPAPNFHSINISSH